MSDVVELVSCCLNVRQHPHRGAVLHVISIEIAFRLLCRHDVADHGISRLAQRRQVLRLQRKSNRFGPFVQVGIGIDRTPLRRLQLALDPQEILHPAMRNQLVIHARNTGLDVRLPPLRPKAFLDRHRRYGHRLQLRIGRMRKIDHSLVLPRKSRGNAASRGKGTRQSLRSRGREQRRRSRAGGGGEEASSADFLESSHRDLHLWLPVAQPVGLHARPSQSRSTNGAPHKFGDAPVALICSRPCSVSRGSFVKRRSATRAGCQPGRRGRLGKRNVG